MSKRLLFTSSQESKERNPKITVHKHKKMLSRNCNGNVSFRKKTFVRSSISWEIVCLIFWENKGGFVCSDTNSTKRESIGSNSQALLQKYFGSFQWYFASIQRYSIRVVKLMGRKLESNVPWKTLFCVCYKLEFATNNRAIFLVRYFWLWCSRYYRCCHLSS